jgi:predicted nucleotidyltransferase
MKDLDEENLKPKIVTLLEKEFGKWLEENENLIIERIPEECKIFPMLCGSIVEGFISRGSDLDFSVVIDDEIKKPKIKGKLSKTFKLFVEKLNENVKVYGLDHVCHMARKLRTTTYLLRFENCKNPQFRVNYFLFGKLLYPQVTKREIRKRLATFSEFLEFKKSFQKGYREKFGYKLFNVNKSVLLNPERYSPKRVYREVQLLVNTFIMAYGLEEEKLTEKMDKELVEKIFELMKSTLMREARCIIEQYVKESLLKLLELKRTGKERAEFKRRRLKFFKEKGLINGNELDKLCIFLKYLLKFVYEPLEKFYEVQIKLTDVLRDHFHVDIQLLGLRKDHAYISLHNHEKVRCMDILPGVQNNFDIYAVVKREVEQELINKNYEQLTECVAIDSSLGINLPLKTHISQKKLGRERIHFKLFSIGEDEDIKNMTEKINKAGLIEPTTNKDFNEDEHV